MSNFESFYYNNLTENDGQNIVFCTEEQKHLKVKRYKIGDDIFITDGKGYYSQAKLIGDNPYAALTSKIMFTPPPKIQISLVLALLKGKSFDDAVKMAVELGVDRIIPWQAERSIVKWKSSEKEAGRLKKITFEAMKQCRRKRLPEVLPLVRSKDISSIIQKNTKKGQLPIVFYENASKSISQVINDFPENIREIQVFIGPEGGITDAEINNFKQCGVLENSIVSLGEAILRAPTAVAKSISILSNIREL